MLLITGPPLSGFSGRRFFFRKGSEEHLSDLRKLPQPWCRAIPKRGRPFSSQEASDHKFRAETEENRIHKRQNRKSPSHRSCWIIKILDIAQLVSVGGDGEFHSNFGLRFDRLSRLVIRLEAPLFDGFPRRSIQCLRTTNWLEILDVPISIDSGEQHHRPFHRLLFR